MKKRHVSSLGGAELSAAFSTAVKAAVARAKAAGHDIPTVTIEVKAPSASHSASSTASDMLQQDVQAKLQSTERKTHLEGGKARKNGRKAA